MTKPKRTIEELEELGLLEGDIEHPFKGPVLDWIDRDGEWWVEDLVGIWRLLGPFESEEIWNGFQLIHLKECHGLKPAEMAAAGVLGYGHEFSIHNAMTEASQALRLPDHTRRRVAAERIHQINLIPRLDNACVHVKTWRNWDKYQPPQGG